MQITEEDFIALREDVRAVKQCLIGYNGDPGLVKDFNTVKEDHYDLRRTVVRLIAFLIGSGILVGGGIGLSYFTGG